jgi:small subunit ribosomal protein S19
MARSIKKGPYIDHNLDRKVLTLNESNKKSVVKTWSRRSMISPDFVGHTFAVHNGNKFIPVYVTENMVGHKLESLHQHAHSAVTQRKRNNRQWKQQQKSKSLY